MPRTSPRLVSRHIVTTETGSIQLWHGETMSWKREEGLAHVGDVAFLDVRQLKDGKLSLAGEGFLGRWTRHLASIGTWRPEVSVSQFVDLFLSGNDAKAGANTPRDFLWEKFGFKQWAILGSELGKVYALDLSTGTVVWEKMVVTPGKRARVAWKKMAVIGDKKSGERVQAVGEVYEQGVSCGQFFLSL
jgi:outer membrane protein assembly factor BamB